MDIRRQLRAVGARITEIILDRTAEGFDANNKPFDDYSTRPFKMPSGAITKGNRKVLLKDGKLHYFKTKTGALWVVIEGGYVALKKVMFRKTSYGGTVNLMATGKMLRAVKIVQVVNTKTGGRIQIGFTRAEEAEKAKWNAEKGREFLGITDEELYNDKQLDEILKEIDITL